MHADEDRADQTFPDADAAVREREEEDRRAGGTPGAPGADEDEKKGGDPKLTFDAATDPAKIGSEDLPTPQAGGYAGRDPKTEMPIMPSVPETGDEDYAPHDAAPDTDKPIDPYG